MLRLGVGLGCDRASPPPPVLSLSSLGQEFLGWTFAMSSSPVLVGGVGRAPRSKGGAHVPLLSATTLAPGSASSPGHSSLSLPLNRRPRQESEHRPVPRAPSSQSLTTTGGRASPGPTGTDHLTRQEPVPPESSPGLLACCPLTRSSRGRADPDWGQIPGGPARILPLPAWTCCQGLAWGPSACTEPQPPLFTPPPPDHSWGHSLDGRPTAEGRATQVRLPASAAAKGPGWGSRAGKPACTEVGLPIPFGAGALLPTCQAPTPPLG